MGIEPAALAKLYRSDDNPILEKRGVPPGVLFSEIEVKRLHTVTLGDTPASVKSNTSNKTGGLDILSIRL